AGGGVDREVDAAGCARRGPPQAAILEEEVAQAQCRERRLEPWDVAALRQPDAAWGLAQGALVRLAPDRELRDERLRDVLHQRQERVGRRAGDELQATGVRVREKAREQPAAAGFEGREVPCVEVEVERGDRTQCRIRSG